MKPVIRLGISSCLLGDEVRYDGGHKRDWFLTDTWGKYVHWVPVCPEVESGLGIPREPMRLAGDPDYPRLITIQSGQDHTEGLLRWAQNRVVELEKRDLWGFIFKTRSPSCGRERVEVFTKEGKPRKASGIFARMFMEHFPLHPVADEEYLYDPERRENFLERIFTYRRWRKTLAGIKSPGNLTRFHSRHRLTILAHSSKHYRAMEKLVSTEGMAPEGLYAEYQRLLMEAMPLKATTSKNTQVLRHMMGRIKKQLSSDERQELQEAIDSYRTGDVPLLVPITLLKHYLRERDEPYLQGQYYLSPYPLELRLKNHA